MGRNQLRKPAGVSLIFHRTFSLIKILLAQAGFSAARAAGKLNAASPARRHSFGGRAKIIIYVAKDYNI
jgi:hypothetical protein